MTPNHSHFERVNHVNSGVWHWRLRATNGEILCAAENFTDKSGCTKGIEAAVRALHEIGVITSIDNTMEVNAEQYWNYPIQDVEE